jgi:hypothetical protein
MAEESDKIIEEVNRQLEANSNKSSKSSSNSDDGEEEEMETDAETPTATAENEDDLRLQERKSKQEQEVIVQTSKVNYLKDMLSFVNQIDAAIPKISRLLFSKTQTDVLEVISFFVTCYEHGFNDMLFGIRKMLALAFNSEKTIKDAVVQAYKKLYLSASDSDTDSITAPIRIAKQLLKLVRDLTICERDSLEELVGEFAITNELDNSVIKVWWEFLATSTDAALAGSAQENTNADDYRLNSIILLGMVIKRVPAKGRANLQVLLDYGLGLADESVPATEFDMLRFKETFIALSYITPDTNTKHLTQTDPNSVDTAAGSSKSKKKAKVSSAVDVDESINDSVLGNGGSAGSGGLVQAKLQFTLEPYKLPNSHVLFERVGDLIVGQFGNFNTTYWLPMCEAALHCVFKVADAPMEIVESIIARLIQKIPPLRHLAGGLPAAKSSNSLLPPVPLFNGESGVTQSQSSAL